MIIRLETIWGMSTVVALVTVCVVLYFLIFYEHEPSWLYLFDQQEIDTITLPQNMEMERVSLLSDFDA